MANLKHAPRAIQVDVEKETAAAAAYFTAMFVKEGESSRAPDRWTLSG